MKRSLYEKKLYELQLLEKKIAALQKIRERVNELAYEFKDDVYALELLSALDRTLFQWLKAMMEGRMRLERRIKQMESQA